MGLFKRVLDRIPEYRYDDAVLSEAHRLSCQARHEEASRYLESSLDELKPEFEADPHLPEFHNIRQALKNHDAQVRALQQCERVLTSNPDEPAVLAHKGMILMELDRPYDAIECFDRSLKINPLGPVVQDRKGYAFYEMEEYEWAVNCYRRSTDMAPNKWVFCRMAEALEKLGRLEDAEECYDKALKIDPSNVSIRASKAALKAHS